MTTTSSRPRKAPPACVPGAGGARPRRAVRAGGSLLLALALAARAGAQEEPAAPRPLPSGPELAALPEDGGPDFNRLVFEASPYLRQHAANPVDWYPWGDAAFERAAREEKPIFLSIGYATCHWCHVMERESFEDGEVAALLNELFVCVKVDREERPEVDQLYMTAVQAVTGGGGWPMTVALTPDRRPFFAATYLPKESRFGLRGLRELLPEIAGAYREERGAVEKSAAALARYLARAAAAPEAGAAPGAELLSAARAELAAAYDAEHGGFGQAPKFPRPVELRLLLRCGLRTGERADTDMAVNTLLALRRGGICDQVGFGFHRYSTDARWLVPHFEKMLYDQALLLLAYVEAWQVSGRPELRSAALEICAYVLRDLRAPGGGFFSAEDADSEGAEGRFYLWTPAQLAAVLGEEDGRFAADFFGVTAAGDVSDPETGLATGASILRVAQPAPAFAAALDLDPGEVARRVEDVRVRLFAAREMRARPRRDEKILTDWNGLMIAGLARAARAFGEPRYAEAARGAADFALAQLRGPDGALHKRWCAGEAALPAVLDDYAFLSYGLIELYQATCEPRYLAAALELAGRMVADFGDPGGAFFLARAGRGDLIVRPRAFEDGALPSGHSVAALDLLLLARLTGRTALEERAERALGAAAAEARLAPSAYSGLLLALDFALGPGQEVVIAGERGAPDAEELLAALGRTFLPGTVVHLRRGGAGGAALAALAEYVGPLEPRAGRATAYVCTGFACSEPTTSVEALLARLRAPAAAAAGDER